MNKKTLALFVDAVLKKLQAHGPVRARAMFGGYGIYRDSIMFASIYNNKLYFRIDNQTFKDYQPYQSQPFIYESTTKTIVLPYLTIPDQILNDPKKLPDWIDKACQAALRNKKTKKKR